MQSVIKKIQRGILTETVLESAYVDVKIQPVNFDKSILIFNSGLYSSGGGNSVCHVTNTVAYLKDEETIRFFGNFVKINSRDVYIHLPRCTWQVIEFN